MKITFHDIKFKNPLIPIYIIIDFKGCICQLNEYLDQLISKNYGMNPCGGPVQSYHKKMHIIPHAKCICNSKNKFIIEGRVAQKCIKKFINQAYKLENIKGLKIGSVDVFGGKKLVDFKPEMKVTNFQEPKCTCDQTKKEHKYKDDFKVANKLDKFILYCYFSNCCCASMTSSGVHVESDNKIPKVKDNKLKKFEQQIEAIEPGKATVYWLWQQFIVGCFI